MHPVGKCFSCSSSTMHRMSKAVFLSALLFLSTVVESRRVKIGSPPRGSSSARTSVIAGRPPANRPSIPSSSGHIPPHQVPVHAVHPNQPAGSRPGQPGGGYHPNQPMGGGVHPGHQGYGHPGGFNTGTGPGSLSRGSQFKTALAAGALGALGGVVTYELGKAIIHSASHPFHINDRPYYFDEKNYKQTSGQFMCSMPLDQLIKQTAQASTTTAAPSAAVSEGVGNETATTQSPTPTTPSPDQLLSNIQYQDGSKPKTIVWSCKSGTEVCCGTDCCAAPPQVSTGGNTNSAGQSSGTSYAGIAFGVLVAILLLMCCCCCLAYRFFRSAFDCCLPTSKYNDNDDNRNVTYTSNKYATDATTVFSEYPQQSAVQQQGYPSAQPGVGYVPSGQGYNYPSQAGGGPQSYPAYPHNY